MNPLQMGFAELLVYEFVLCLLAFSILLYVAWRLAGRVIEIIM